MNGDLVTPTNFSVSPHRLGCVIAVLEGSRVVVNIRLTEGTNDLLSRALRQAARAQAEYEAKAKLQARMAEDRTEAKPKEDA
jgi:hypothetical protein